MWVYDDLKMKSLIKNKHQGHLIYPRVVKEPRLWKAYFLLLKLNGIAVFRLAYEASWFQKNPLQSCTTYNTHIFWEQV